MPNVTKTIGQIHFEALETKRFEDLVRQLLYDFRNWRALEPTGRMGSDDGFDARGFETLTSYLEPLRDDDEDPDETTVSIDEDRQWLIQCKREGRIPPSLLLKYLNEISEDERKHLYGIIFTAACDFSKKARDTFRQWCATHGIMECYLWGKADIEDMLFQLKNDHLLFAYFGISLHIRRRSIKTVLRSKLATKRKCERIFGTSSGYRPILLRDPTDDRYPWKPNASEQKRNPMRWRVGSFLEQEPNGIKVQLDRFFAYISDDNVSWDYIKENNRGNRDDPWEDEHENNWEEDDKRRRFWMGIPEQNRGSLMLFEVIRYEDILDIDATGDKFFRHPHVYVPPEIIKEQSYYAYIERWGQFRENVRADDTKRIKFFPDKFPDVQSKEADLLREKPLDDSEAGSDKV
jgi:hypothetical protein